MNESQKDFRERLLEAEQLSPTLREKYEKEVQAMLEQRFTGVKSLKSFKRWTYIFGAAFTMGLGVLFATVTLTLFLLLFTGGKHPNLVNSVFAVVCALGFLVMAGVGLILLCVDQAQLKTREKLLEIEYRLAQMAEEMAKKEQK